MNLKIVIILGNKLKSPEIHPELKGRLDVGINVFKEMSTDYLVLSGGKSNQNIEYAECELMKDYAIKKGIPNKKIVLECESMDTIGNAYFTRNIINKMKGISMIYVVSSCYHMKRVKFIFEKVYGKHHNLNFDYCYPYNNPEAEREEEKSIGFAKEFFDQVSPGDLKEIRRRLYTIHELYSKRTT